MRKDDPLNIAVIGSIQLTAEESEILHGIMLNYIAGIHGAGIAELPSEIKAIERKINFLRESLIEEMRKRINHIPDPPVH